MYEVEQWSLLYLIWMLISFANGLVRKNFQPTSLKVSEVSCSKLESMSNDIMHVSDNEMDGEALETLLGTSQGPDCLKELITRIGTRLKVYQRIKTLLHSQIFSVSYTYIQCNLY